VSCCDTALAVVALAIGAQGAAASTITKLEGPEGCHADPASSLDHGTCKEARGIDDVTDVEISPDGEFLYAAAASSNSIAIFRRSPDGELTQLPGSAGCIVAQEGPPISGCAAGNGLEGPSALAISPDGSARARTGSRAAPTPTG
jgi:hypothetical protein